MSVWRDELQGKITLEVLISPGNYKVMSYEISYAEGCGETLPEAIINMAEGWKRDGVSKPYPLAGVEEKEGWDGQKL